MVSKICVYLIESILYLLLIFMPVVALYGGVTVWSMSILHLLVWMLIVLWAIAMGSHRTFSLRFMPLGVACLLFVLLALSLEMFRSTYREAAHLMLTNVTSYLMLIVVVMNNFRKRNRIIRLLWVILLCGFSLSIYGITEAVVAKDAFMVSATFINHNHFAGYLEMVIPLGIGMFLGERKIERRLILCVFISVMTAALLLTLSRGGIISFFCTAVFLLIMALRGISLKKTGFWLSVSVLLCSLVLGTLGTTRIIERFQDAVPEEASVATRLSIMKSSLCLAADAPIVGHGLNSFEFIYPKYREPAVWHKVVYAHNDYLHLLTEMGLPGLVLMLTCMALFVTNSLKLYQRKHDRQAKGILLGVLAGFVSIAIHSLVDFNMRLPANASLMAILVGLCYTKTVVGEERDPIAGIWSWKVTVGSRRRALLLVLAMVTAVSLWAWAPVKRLTAFYWHHKALAAIQAEHHTPHSIETAATALRRAIKINPYDAELHYALARVLQAGIQRGWITDTEADPEGEYRAALELNPRNTGYYLGLADWHIKHNNMTDAKKAIVTACRLDPYNPFPWLLLAEKIYLKCGEIPYAILTYRHALTAYPLVIRRVLKELFKYTRDYHVIKQALPEDASIHYAFAGYLKQHGLEEAALEECKKAVSLSPDNIQFGSTLAHVYYTRKMYPEAVALWKSLLKDTKHPAEIYKSLARTYREQDLLLEAIQHYKEAIEHNSGDIALYRELASIYERREEHQKIERLWRKGVNRNPCDIRFWKVLGTYYQKHHDRGELEALWVRGVKVNPSDVDFQIELAECYKLLDKWMLAFQAAKNAVALAPDSVQPRLYLADLYAENGLYSRALSQLKFAMVYHPDDPALHLKMASVYELMEKPGEAVKEYEKVLEMDQGSEQAEEGIKKLFSQEVLPF